MEDTSLLTRKAISSFFNDSRKIMKVCLMFVHTDSFSHLKFDSLFLATLILLFFSRRAKKIKINILKRHQNGENVKLEKCENID